MTLTTDQEMRIREYAEAMQGEDDTMSEARAYALAEAHIVAYDEEYARLLAEAEKEELPKLLAQGLSKDEATDRIKDERHADIHEAANEAADEAEKEAEAEYTEDE